jgi:hypothetical protein
MTENSYETPRMEVVEIEVENILTDSQNLDPFKMN